MYNLYSKETSGYYLKVRNAQVQLISCLPDSNRNSAREFVWVSGNWHANELTCPTSPQDVGWYRSYHIYFYHTFFFFFCLFMIASLFVYILMIFIYDDADGKKFKPDSNAIHMRDLNFVLRSTIFVHYNGQLRASHLIFGCTPIYTSYQDPGQALTIDSPLLSYIALGTEDFCHWGLQ